MKKTTWKLVFSSEGKNNLEADFQLTNKEVLGALGAALDFFGILPYFVGIVRGQIRPHLFSWLIWTTVMGVGFRAQIAGDAGAGSWTMGMCIVTSGMVCILAFFKGELAPTRSDWICFLAALSAIPLWIATKEPLPSVLLVTAIDLVAYGPTLRKSWDKPHEELAIMWFLGAVKFLLAIAGIKTYSLITWLYPAACALANTIVVSVIVLRRAQLNRPDLGCS